MVAQNKLRTSEEKHEKNDLKFVTALGLNNALNGSNFSVTSNIRNMSAEGLFKFYK